MTDAELQSARDFANAMQTTLYALGLAPSLMPATATIPAKMLALCDEVLKLREERDEYQRLGNEWMAQYHGSIDRARIAEQDRDELDEMLSRHRGMCANREPSDDPHTIGARCERFLGHPAPCRWSRP